MRQCNYRIINIGQKYFRQALASIKTQAEQKTGRFWLFNNNNNKMVAAKLQLLLHYCLPC